MWLERWHGLLSFHQLQFLAHLELMTTETRLLAPSIFPAECIVAHLQLGILLLNGMPFADWKRDFPSVLSNPTPLVG